MRKPAQLAIGVLLGVLILLVVGGILAEKRIPDVGAQLSVLRPAILVSITGPAYGQHVAPGEPIGVLVVAEGGEDLQSVQAFADGAPLAQVMATAMEARPVRTMHQWVVPEGEGWHALTARATGADGESVVSNPVWVEVVVHAPATIPADEPVIAGQPAIVFGIPTDTEDFEARLDIEVERLLAEGEGEASTAWELPSIPTPAPDLPGGLQSGEAGSPPAGASAVQKYRLWLAQAVGGVDVAPAAPSLSGSVEGCTVRLVVSDAAEDELGIRLYHLGPNSSAWDVAADLGVHPGAGAFGYDDPDRGPGKHAYYAASYNAAGETPGSLISLEVTAKTCAALNPTVVSLNDAVLTPARPVDRLYCYASTNGLDWGRIPAEPDSFVFPTEGAFDLGPHLRAIALPDASIDLRLECWGWEGGELVPLGSGGGAISTEPIYFEAGGFTFRGQPVHEPASPGSYRFKPLNFAPPMNLHYADSLAGCAAYTGDDAYLEWACENLIDIWGEPVSGHNILVWHWHIYDNCNAQEDYCGYNVPKEEVAGYHVYRQTGNNEPILIRTVERNDVYMAVLTPGETTSASESTRYFVRAYMHSGYESGDSNYLQARPAPFRMTLPALYTSVTGVKVYKPGRTPHVVAGPGDLEEFPESGVPIGYLRHHSKHLPRSVSMYFHAYVAFDLSQVQGTIGSASLKWDGEIHTSGPGNSLWEYRCFNRLRDYFGQPVAYGPWFPVTLDTDVTDYVRLGQQLASGEAEMPLGIDLPTYPGFWLWSGDTGLAGTEYNLDLCVVKVRDVRLEVEYFK